MKIKKFFILFLIFTSTFIYANELSQNSLEGKSQDVAALSDSSSRLSFYEPLFIAFGHPDTKVQLSFKYRLIKDYAFYFAFKEEIFWDIFEDSAPFSNTQYSPEAFYRIDLKDNAEHLVDFGFFRHRSNGRAGLDSRSLNQSYLRIINQLSSSELKFGWGGEVHIDYSKDDNNLDFYKYQGFYTIEIALSQLFKDTFFNSELKLRFRSAGENGLNPLLGNKSLTYQVRPLGVYFSPAFFVQTSYGYSESLLRYNESEFTIRGGISLFD